TARPKPEQNIGSRNRRSYEDERARIPIVARSKDRFTQRPDTLSQTASRQNATFTLSERGGPYNALSFQAELALSPIDIFYASGLLMFLAHSVTRLKPSHLLTSARPVELGPLLNLVVNL
ncbi:hypothetical protein, partial [Denitrobaculum tricleocarpae]|uniref:hypothetical protein n=1 Tax=Denitrobaculum tricleocarpae TaxID=2591009 RepID=UPI001C550C1A